jgi:Ulp1 family protease
MFQNIRQFLDKFANRKLRLRFVDLPCPQQSNAVDCGVYLLLFAKMICLDQIQKARELETLPMAGLRKNFAKKILLEFNKQ